MVDNKAYVSTCDDLSYGNYDLADPKLKAKAEIANIQGPVRLELKVEDGKYLVRTGENIIFVVTPTPERPLLYDWHTGEEVSEYNRYEMTLYKEKTVQVSATDDVCGIVQSNPVTVEVEWPNAITNRGKSEINGVFMRDVNYPFKLYVFNRYGITMYKGSDAWDGTYNGKPVDPGTYYYIVELPDGDIRKATIEVVKE
jgi:gliding motility-associated-like protein